MIKVKRSFPAPDSLEIEAKKKDGKYNKSDVVERLKVDFNDKCYICEIKGLQDPVVEHLLPHKDGKYPNRKFDWDNLFWSCNHCNSVKNSRKYDAGIIDCCKQDPERLLNYSVLEDDIQVSAVVDDPKAKLTAELIYECFNTRNTGIRDAACDIRIKELMKSMNVLYKSIEAFRKDPLSQKNRRTLLVLLRKESAFAFLHS